jgi:hypothetical protein
MNCSARADPNLAGSDLFDGPLILVAVMPSPETPLPHNAHIKLYWPNRVMKEVLGWFVFD